MLSVSLIVSLLVTSAILFAYEEYQEGVGTVTGDKIEHWVSIPHRASLVLFGYLFAEFGNMIEIPLLLGLYWLCTDGVMNLFKRRSFFAVSAQSGNPFEKWNLVKFGLIVIGLIFEINYRIK